MAVLMDGMKMARRFASTPAMRQYLTRDVEVPDTTIPHAPSSDAYLTCVARAAVVARLPRGLTWQAVSAYASATGACGTFPASTCAEGP